MSITGLPTCYRCGSTPCECKDGITLIHGDCRDVLPMLEAGSVDLVLTDPPYGIGHLMKGGKNTGHWNVLSQGNPWDKDAPDLTFIMGIAPYFVIWGGNYFPLQPSRCWFVWVKTNAVPTMGQCELAWTNLERPIQRFEWRVGGNNGHPTAKPLELFRWCVVESRTAGTILDPFAGSGTTGRACKDLGRRCILIEIEERYVEIAAGRLEQEVLFT